MESVGSVVEAKTKFLNRMYVYKSIRKPGYVSCILRYVEIIIIVVRNVKSTVKCVRWSSVIWKLTITLART